MSSTKFFIGSIATLVIATVVGSATPIRAQSQPISMDAVNAACLSPTDHMTVQAYAYVSGYLMCITVDNLAEGVSVYQETAPGSGQFALLAGAGGLYPPGDLIAFGIPADVANALYASIVQQEQG